MIRENGRRDLHVESVVRGYHVYKEDWSPNIGDRFGVEVEETNIHDRYAVAVVVNDRITGHPLTSQVSTSVKSHHVEFTLTKLENIAEIRKLLYRIFETDI